MKILGISAFYHDSSSALIVDGKIISATQEERFSRIKNDESFPQKSILFNLEFAKINPEQIDAVIFYEKPFLKFERLLETYLAFPFKGFVSFKKAMPVWLNQKLFLKKTLIDNLINIGLKKEVCENIFFSDHHQSHAAAAFYPSPFHEAIVLTLDGVGEWATTSVHIGRGHELTKVKEIHFPHSLGLLYSSFTYYCGFKVNSGEYKLMGLAPYGKPIYADLIKEKLIVIKDDGTFQINIEYFSFCTGLTMTNEKFNELFNRNFRNPADELKQVHMDLAASIQLVTEEILLKMAIHLKNTYGIDHLCLAGGVALNCVANGKLLAQKIFSEIWIQPAAGDAGGSLGAALTLYYNHFKNSRNISNSDSMNGSYLGPQYNNNEIAKFLDSKKIKYEKYEFSPEFYLKIANEISNGKTIGWFQGRMEYGPRSLGNRSIIADPRNQSMQKTLNLKIKFRESFRPFAPAILEEDASEYFEIIKHSPYMLFTYALNYSKRLAPDNSQLFGIDLLNQVRSIVPAITHVDYSARVQTVNKDVNPTFHHLLKSFKELTGCPLLINTSFNIRGEPIVCSPEDAYRCFMGTNLDILVLENFVVFKSDKDEKHDVNYLNKFMND